MKVVTFGGQGAEQFGVLVGTDHILPLQPVLTRAGIYLTEVPQLLAVWPAIAPLATEALDHASRGRLPTVAIDSVRLGAPVPRPGKVIGVALNYAGQTPGRLAPTPPDSAPVLFLKPPSAVSGPHDPIVLPPESAELDWEIELALVIGAAGTRIPAEHAWQHVAGYTIANDVTARDIVRGAGFEFPLQLQIARGKGYPSFCPLGPWLVTCDEIPGGTALTLTLSVNGVQHQEGSTANMLVGIPELIESVSAVMPLMPGDVVLTGTPPGCGYQLDPPVFLADGDIVHASITGLGEMCTPVAHDQTTTTDALRTCEGAQLG